MKKSLATILLIMCIMAFATLQVASAVSETIELPPLQTVNRPVDLVINDRLTVTITAKDNDAYVPLSARILDPTFDSEMTWTNYRNNSFSYIAYEKGTHIIGIVYGNETLGTPSSSIEVTLSYEVEHLSATATPQPTQTQTGNPQDWTMILVVVAVVALVVIAVAALVLKRKK